MRFKFTLELRGVAAAALVAAMAWRCDGLRVDGHLLGRRAVSAGASVSPPDTQERPYPSRQRWYALVASSLQQGGGLPPRLMQS